MTDNNPVIFAYTGASSGIETPEYINMQLTPEGGVLVISRGCNTQATSQVIIPRELVGTLSDGYHSLNELKVNTTYINRVITMMVNPVLMVSGL